MGASRGDRGELATSDISYMLTDPTGTSQAPAGKKYKCQIGKNDEKNLAGPSWVTKHGNCSV